MSKILLNTAAAMLAAAGLAGAASAAFAQADGPNPWAAVGDGSLANAITTIEGATGGRVLEIRFRMAGGDPRYDAIVASGPNIERVSVGVHPGDQVIQINERDLPTWMAGHQLRSDQRSIRQAKVPLAEAVVMAHRMVGGPAVDAGLASPLSSDNLVMAYNIEVIKDGDPVRVAIDAQTGAPIANPDALYQPWSPERSFRHADNRG
jgi:hypothetical protein